MFFEEVRTVVQTLASNPPFAYPIYIYYLYPTTHTVHDPNLDPPKSPGEHSARQSWQLQS